MPKSNHFNHPVQSTMTEVAMIRILLSVRRFLGRESGHAMVEYLFMLSLIIVAAILGVKLVGETALNLFETTRDTLP